MGDNYIDSIISPRMIQLLIEIESKIIEISDKKVTKDEDGGRYMRIMSIKLDVFRLKRCFI